MKVTTCNFRTYSRLIEMVQNIKKMDACIEKGKKTACIRKVEWISPFSLLPLVVYAANNNLQLTCSSKRKGVKSYLRTVCFPSGTTDLRDLEMNYLPLTKISCGSENTILGQYEERILQKVGEEFRSSFISGLKFLTSELQLNVEQHAKMSHYWLFAQYWGKTKTCEICLADTGIGYKDSYLGTKHEVNTHSMAIQNAIRGISSKEDDRGAGIPGILKMFIDGYKGEMVILSGNALMYVKSGSNPVVFNCPIHWKGAFVGLKFRLKDIDVSQYY